MTAVARRQLRLLAWVTVAVGLSWAAAGLAFRLTGAYAALPIAANEPYGISDVLELLHFGVLLAVSSLAGLQGVVLALFGRFRLRPLGALLLCFALALPAVYIPMHTWAARLALEPLGG